MKPFKLSKYNNIEKALFEKYSQIMTMTMDIPLSKAKEMTKDMINQAIEESKKEGTYYLPQNLGDIILENTKSDNPTINKIAKNIRQKLPQKKAEGVREEDIIWWWNLNDIERRVMLKHDDIAKTSLFISKLKEINEPSKEKAANIAASQVRKFHPTYGDPDDTTHTNGDDRPLPYELKDRVNIYIEKRYQSDPHKYKKELEQSNTFNALIRKEIRSGNI